MTNLIISFFLGVLVATYIFWIFHRMQYAIWKKEFRRLMCGIKKAKADVLDDKIDRAVIAHRLNQVFFDEHIWPRE